MPVQRRPSSGTRREAGVSIPRWFLTDVNGSRDRPPSLLSHLRAFYQQLDQVPGSAEEDPCPALELAAEEIEPTEEAGMYSDSDDEDPEAAPSPDDAPTAVMAAAPQIFDRPGPCSFLMPGQTFSGSQRMPSDAREEDWKVTVRIQGYEPQRGYICGVMEALNTPSSSTPVVTFWEGELVDNAHHSFFTRNWESSHATDLNHWSKFPGFSSMKHEVVRQWGRCSALASSPYVFMRWKERCFVNMQGDCGLSIAGFYYVCVSRKDGSVQGYYYDLSSTPFQQLSLQPQPQGTSGHAFGSYTLR